MVLKFVRQWPAAVTAPATVTVTVDALDGHDDVRRRVIVTFALLIRYIAVEKSNRNPSTEKA